MLIVMDSTWYWQRLIVVDFVSHKFGANLTRHQPKPDRTGRRCQHRKRRRNKIQNLKRQPYQCWSGTANKVQSCTANLTSSKFFLFDGHSWCPCIASAPHVALAKIVANVIHVFSSERYPEPNYAAFAFAPVWMYRRDSSSLQNLFVNLNQVSEIGIPYPIAQVVALKKRHIIGSGGNTGKKGNLMSLQGLSPFGHGVQNWLSSCRKWSLVCILHDSASGCKL